jgi:hypothetical protein
MRASTHHSQTRKRLLSARNTAGLGVGIELHWSVIFDPNRSGSSHDHVGELSQGMKHGFVGPTAEPPGATFNLDGPIDACDHVHQNPRPVRRSGSGLGRDKFHRVEIGEGSGKELIHMATLGVNR